MERFIPQHIGHGTESVFDNDHFSCRKEAAIDTKDQKLAEAIFLHHASIR
jgi:hypothetical protein